MIFEPNNFEQSVNVIIEPEEVDGVLAALDEVPANDRDKLYAEELFERIHKEVGARPKSDTFTVSSEEADAFSFALEQQGHPAAQSFIMARTEAEGEPDDE